MRDDFTRDGYVVVDEPIATPGELAELRGLIETAMQKASTQDDHVNELAGAEAGHILEVIGATELVPALRRSAVFRRCRALASDVLGVDTAPFFDHVIHKPPQNGASTAWHQDLAYMGTTEPPAAAHIWFALQDATVENGCMQYIPGSHRSLHAHQPRGGVSTLHALEALEVDATPAVACPVPAGGLVIHHPGVLHYSPPNMTDAPRTAWILHFREEGTWGGRTVVPRPVRKLARGLRSRSSM